MLLFLTVQPDLIIVRARAEGPGAIGDLFEEVTPGGQFYDIPYEVLRTAGSGQHTLSSLQALAAEAVAEVGTPAPVKSGWPYEPHPASPQSQHSG
jgi:hypothetical protein